MPELPEVECLCRELETRVLGGKILQINFLREDLREAIPFERLREVLNLHEIIRVFRRSKYILLQTKKGFGVFHLGMTGNIRFKSSSELVHKHTHVLFELLDRNEQHSWLHFIDPRRFGRIDAILGADSELKGHPLFAHLGPEPISMSAGMLSEHFYALSRKRHIPIKSFLMDPRVTVGIGNIYATEALFKAGINPARSVSTVSQKNFHRLSSEVIEILREAIDLGGTSINDYRHLDGESGGFQMKLMAYGRQGEECRICGEKIKMVKIGGRSSFFCEKCQA